MSKRILSIAGIVGLCIVLAYVGLIFGGESAENAGQPTAQAEGPFFEKQQVIPLQDEHVHGSTIVELPNGDLLAAWFQGDGERWADDVRILGSRKKSGEEEWSEAFQMADVKEFPDINPVLFVDGEERLWLVWYAVIANQWSTSLLNYRTSENYQDMDGVPDWDWQQNLMVKPGDKTERGVQPGDSFVESVERQVEEYGDYLRSIDSEYSERWEERGERIVSLAAGEDMTRSGHLYNEDGSYEETDLGYPYFRRMGWQTRSKPTITDSGRLILPLYSDGFSFSLMAITDDWGENWSFSEPLVGPGNIQPAIAITESGDLVTYMRDNGPPPKRLHVSRSTDEGETWSTVNNSQFPNPGAAADIATLDDGSWILIYNDLESGRHSLAVSLSEDDGETWPWTRRIEFDEDEEISAHYPAIIQGADGTLHASYSLFLPTVDGERRRTVSHATFNKEWLKEDS